MPPSITIGSFVLGAVLLLIAILSGGFKIFGAEVSGNTSVVGRLVAFVLGIIFILIGFSGYEGKLNTRLEPTPTPITTPTAYQKPVDNDPTPATKPTPIPKSTDTSTSESTVSPPSASAGLAPGAAFPTTPVSCPYVQGAIWLQSPNIWYGPFGNGEGLMFSSYGGFFVWDPARPNMYGTYGMVIPYPDPYKAIQRNVWIPLQQSRFNVCVDGAGNVYGYQSYR